MRKNQDFFLYLICYFILAFLFTTPIFSQSSVDYKWYANVNGGIAQGFGDVQEENNHISKLQNETDFGFGFRFGRYLNPVFAVHAQFLKANLVGEKTSYNLKYNSDLIESQLGFSVNILNIFSSEKKNRLINVYATSGIGMAFFKSEVSSITTEDIVNNNGIKTDDNGQKDEREIALIIPIGGGIDFRLSDKWYINLESVLRITNTDKLDVVESGSQNDAFFYTSLGLTYHFGTKEKASNQIPEKEISEVQIPIPDYFVNVKYFLPEEVISGEEFKMRCLITKGNIGGKAELTQVLPIGFIVKDEMIGGTHTEFQNYTLHLYWDELPADSTFEISYTIMPEKIYGVLPYTSILYLDKTAKEYKFKSSIVVKKEEIAQQESINTKELLETENTVPEVVSLEPSPKIEFSVQVRASKQAIIPITKLVKKYNLTGNINEDFSGGWYRYSIGSFSTYNDARGFKNTLITKNGIGDAFIVVFHNGVRLEALNDLKDIDPDNYSDPGSNMKNPDKFYRVQILAIWHNTINIETIKDTYGLDKDINEEVFKTWRRYTIGLFKTFSEANDFKNTLIEKGISDAFVVIYEDGKRLNINKRVD